MHTPSVAQMSALYLAWLPLGGERICGWED